MARPAWAWYDSTDTTTPPVFTFAPEPGTPTAAQQGNVWNDKGAVIGADDSSEFLLTALSCDQGDADFSFSDILAANGWIEVRLIGQGGTGIQAQTSDWTPVGRNRFLRVKGVPRDCKREVETRVVIPGGIQVAPKTVRLWIIEEMQAIPLENGVLEFGGRGVILQLGLSSETYLLRGFDIEPAGSPDNTFTVTAGVGVFGGVPAGSVAQVVTMNDEDVNSAALAAGEEYLVTVSRGVSATPTTTKSAKGTAPLPDSDFPETPAGEEFVGHVRVPFSAVIDTPEIDQTDRRYGGLMFEPNGLGGYVGVGRVVVGDSIVVFANRQPVTFEPSDTNYVWVTPGGDLAVNQTGAKPADQALLIWEADTDGSGVTATRDRRFFCGGRLVHLELLASGTLASSEKRYAALPGNGRCYLLPIRGVDFSVGSKGATSGSTTFDVNYSEEGASFASIYPSSGTEDLRPDIPYNAADPRDAESTPEVYSFLGGTRFQSNVENVPGTASTDQIGRLTFMQVGE